MIPDFTLIDPEKILPLDLTHLSCATTLYYSYRGLYDFCLLSECHILQERKIPDPKLPTDPTLNITDFIALGNSLATYGYIG